MRKFSKLKPTFWRSRPVHQLEANETLLLLYYMTCPHQTSAGCCAIPDAYACADLRWGETEYRACREALVAASLIEFDPKTDELFVKNWFEHNPVTGPKHQAGVDGEISGVDSETIQFAARQALAASVARPLVGAPAAVSDALRDQIHRRNLS